MTSISTYGLYSALMQSVQSVQSSVATASQQESSGLVSTETTGLGTNTQQYLNLEAELKEAQSWESSATTASSRVETMYSAVGTMIDELTSYKTELSSALSSTESDNSSTITTEASSTLEELASELNTKYGDLYLFGGSRTDTAPVDLTSYPSGTLSSTSADTSYYQGDDQKASVQIGSADTVTYGVTADDSAFEKAMRAAALIADGSADSTSISAAYSLVGDAIDDLSELQSQLSGSASRLSEATNTQTSFASILTTQIGDLTEVDTAEASTRLTTYQTQLEASYSAVAVVLKLNLSSYLQ